MHANNCVFSKAATAAERTLFEAGQAREQGWVDAGGDHVGVPFSRVPLGQHVQHGKHQGRVAVRAAVVQRRNDLDTELVKRGPGGPRNNTQHTTTVIARNHWACYDTVTGVTWL